MTALVLAAFGTPVCALIVAISVGVLLEPPELSAIRSVGQRPSARGSRSELPGRLDGFGPGAIALVLLRRDGPVGGISLNCPEKRNALDRASLAVLENHLDDAQSFEGARS